MVNNNRSKNPWLGSPSKTREKALVGYRCYWQVRYFDGKDNKNKKFPFQEGNDKSEADALHKANMYRQNMIPVILDLGGTIHA